ncbi:DUF6503 family protein [uncultured Dokdonia sp.]|uniref:DUF6503 family protein n=1 Tax=uncultured Dokdonia sp. TaxID=575653 RepID=UPI0026352556|nr:DUF6503 family protein [uncultured Dokdonia sp.]
MKNLIYSFSIGFLLIGIISCESKTSSPQKRSPQNILNSLQNNYGSSVLQQREITFDVNDVNYKIELNNQDTHYTMSRTSRDVDYKTTYKNGFIEYFINDSLQDESTYNRKFFDSKLDGFIFNTFAPHLLTGNRYNVENLPDTVINDSVYLTLRVKSKKVPDVPTDEYYFYIDKKTNLVMYSAQYHKLSYDLPTFRRYTNHKKIKGILFADYYLFQADNGTLPIDKLHTGFSNLTLKPIEQVTYKNIEVKNLLK